MTWLAGYFWVKEGSGFCFNVLCQMFEIWGFHGSENLDCLFIMMQWSFELSLGYCTEHIWIVFQLWCSTDVDCTSVSVLGVLDCLLVMTQWKFGSILVMMQWRFGLPVGYSAVTIWISFSYDAEKIWIVFHLWRSEDLDRLSLMTQWRFGLSCGYAECSLIGGCECFWGNCCFHLWNRWLQSN
jgi:hypothetical protein